MYPSLAILKIVRKNLLVVQKIISICNSFADRTEHYQNESTGDVKNHQRDSFTGDTENCQVKSLAHSMETTRMTPHLMILKITPQMFQLVM